MRNAFTGLFEAGLDKSRYLTLGIRLSGLAMRNPDTWPTCLDLPGLAMSKQ